MTCSICHPRRGAGCELCPDRPAGALAPPPGAGPAAGVVDPPARVAGPVVPALEAEVARLRGELADERRQIEAERAQWDALQDALEAEVAQLRRDLASEQGHADGLARALRRVIIGFSDERLWDSELGAGRAALAAHDERRTR